MLSSIKMKPRRPSSQTTFDGKRKSVGTRLPQVGAVSIVDRATDELRRAIVNGGLKPGQSVVIREIASELGISPIPVREALQRLEGEGFVTLRHARSAIVSPMSVADLDDIYRLRSLIEGDVAERSAARLTAHDFELLDELTAEMLEPVNENRRFAIHQEFHLALLRPAASRFELRIFYTLWSANERYLRTLVMPASGAEELHEHERHVHLVEVARRSPKKLKQELRDHLAAGRALILERMPASFGP